MLTNVYTKNYLKKTLSCTKIANRIAESVDITRLECV
jgi:hypothetical protein